MTDQFTLTDIENIARSCGLTDAEMNELLTELTKLSKSDNNLSLDSLYGYANLMIKYHGDNYSPKIESFDLKSSSSGEMQRLWCIEPHVGSTTYVIEIVASISELEQEQEQKPEPKLGLDASHRRLILIDSGFPCYAKDLEQTLKTIFPDYDTAQKDLILTHMDMDHVGLLDGFENIWMSNTTYENFAGVVDGKKNLRERDVSRAPVYRISSLLSLDRTKSIERMRSVNALQPNRDEPLSYIGSLSLGSLNFSIYETSGGHVEGSIILYESECRIVFAGDTLVNPSDMYDSQKSFIALGTAMLKTLNANSAKAKVERKALYENLDDGNWLLCPGHGLPFWYP